MESKKLNLIYFKISSFFFLILISFISSFALQGEEIYISEINFINDEYVEIFSTNFLNLSDGFIYDDNGYSRFNTLSLLKYSPNSNLTLIIGSRFLNNPKYNISNLNCTIYLTSSTQVSNGGLKIAGEEILIEYNSNNSYLAFYPEETFNFNDNQSLHFLKNGSYFIGKNSPCNLSLPKNLNSSDKDKLNANISMPTNQTFYNYSNQNKSDFIFNNDFNLFCYNYFKIVWNNLSINSSKINSFLITNCHENVSENLVKNNFFLIFDNFNSSNLDFSSLSFLTKNISFIHKNSSLFNQSNFFFNFLNELNLEFNSSSNLIIKNKDDFINNFSNEIFFEIYRGPVENGTVKIFLNDKQIYFVETPKFEKIKTKLFIEINFEIENILRIEWFGKSKEIVIPKKSLPEKILAQNTPKADSNQLSSNLKNENKIENEVLEEIEKIDWINNAPSFYFNISIAGFSILEDKIYFNLTFPKNFNFDSNCKILQGRRVISNINENLDFGLNFLKFNEQLSNDSFLNSKINCRIDPSWRVTPIYFDSFLEFYSQNFSSFIFDVKINSNLTLYDNSLIDENSSLKEKRNESILENTSNGVNIFDNSYQEISGDIQISNSNTFEEFSSESNLKKNIEIQEKQVLKEDDTLSGEFTSKQLGFKNNAFIGILVGGVLLVIFIIFFK